MIQNILEQFLGSYYPYFHILIGTIFFTIHCLEMLSFRTLLESTKRTWITDKRQESVDQFVGRLGKVVEVRLAVVVEQEGAPLLEDEPHGGPDRDVGEWADQFLALRRVWLVAKEGDLQKIVLKCYKTHNLSEDSFKGPNCKLLPRCEGPWTLVTP